MAHFTLGLDSVKMDELSRSQRERQQYNKTLQRQFFQKLYPYFTAYSDKDLFADLHQTLSCANGKTVLELGAYSWKRWLEQAKIFPQRLECVNISEAETEIGKRLAKDSVVQPAFHIMDAHNLGFKDATFDIVYGGGVLHHLDLEAALMEINRILKPGGKLIFIEPLGINIVAKLVRHFTPKARTVDEQPFGFKELSILENYFDIHSISTYDLFSTLFSVPSQIFFKYPRNILSYLGYRLDVFLPKILPSAQYLYYRMLILADKRER